MAAEDHAVHPHRERSESMTDHIDHGRRQFLGTAAATIAGARLAMVGTWAGSSTEHTTRMETRAMETSASFGELRQIDAGELSVGYSESGPPGGRPVILLHGWPYDIHSFAE